MMTPVFRYRWHLWTFLGFLAFILSLPLLPKPSWVDRSPLYLSKPDNGTWLYFANHTLQETSDIDVLFVGPSVMEAAINPHIIKDALRPVLGREPVVYVAGHSKYGLDLDYIMVQDILRKRNVKLLVLYRSSARYDHIVKADVNVPHLYSNYLWDYALHAPALRQLPMKDRKEAYFFSVLSGLRLLLGPFKDRLPLVKPRTCERPSLYYGACRRMTHDPTLRDIIPEAPVLTPDRLLHDYPLDDTASSFIQLQWQDSPYEQVFINGIFALAKQYGTSAAFLYIPTGISTSLPSTLPLRRLAYSERHLAGTPIIGAAANRVYPKNMSPANIIEIFYQPQPDGCPSCHLNYAGADYFTNTIAPGVTELYLRSYPQYRENRSDLLPVVQQEDRGKADIEESQQR